VGDFARLHGGSAHVLSARAYPLGGTLPFSLWVEALEPALATMQGEDVDRLCGGFVDDLGGLFHSVAAIRPGASHSSGIRGGDPPRLRLLEGLTHLLDALSAEHPVIAALDDVHLADPSSWDVLRHLARRIPDGALLVLATARPAELAENDVAARVLLELEQDGGLTRLSVGPLSRADLSSLAEVMIEQTPPPALVDWLEDRTRGNVLFANGLLRALLEEGGDLTAPRLERFPESLTERVIARIKDHTDDEKTTLEVIALLGRPAAIGELVAITGRGLEDLARILGVLVSGRAVTEEERGRDLTYEIHHPLVRDVIYQAIGGARRRLLHRQVAAALRRNGRIGEAARHFARSADAGDSDAIDTLREAIQQAEAREAYREALELLGELGDLLPAGDARWLDVSEAMSWRAEWVVDHRADTHALLGIRALRELDGLLAGSPDASRRAAVKFRLANFLAWGTGDLKDAGAALEEAVTLSAGSGDARQTLLVERELAWVKGLSGQFAAMEADATRIATAAGAMGDRFVRLQALAAAAYAAIFLGRFREAEDWLRDALTIAQEDLKAYRYTALAGVLGTSLALEGRIDEAGALFAGAKLADAAYHDSVLLELEIVTHWLGGDFRTAVDRARESSAWNPTGHSRRRAIGDVFAAKAALELGEIAEMQRFLARSRRALGTGDWSHFVQLCEHAEALAAYSQGRAAEAVAGLRRSSVTMLGRGLDGWVGLVLIDQAEIEAAIGDPSAARESAAQLRSIADRTAIPAHRGLAALASSFAEHAAGNLNEAAEDAGRAIAELATTGWRAYLARAHMALGRASAGTDRPRAVAAFGQAVALFEAAGATDRRQAAVDAVRALGSPGRRAAAAAGGPGSLTARERDVARLAASGLSAKEIADRLFVSERTVETHLTRVYAKLGVTTKVELVRRAGEFSL
jgi:DNA-binding CsgD family transcriptional regulator